MTALCRDGKPTGLFFDFGLGSRRNAYTAPKTLPPDAEQVRMVILSHWDEDHYAGIGRVGAAWEALWIAPPEATTFHALDVAGRLNAKGRLRVWDLDGMHGTAPAIRKAAAKGRSKNDCGLVVGIRGALLPGDARLSKLDSEMTKGRKVLCAPHHGAASAADGEIWPLGEGQLVVSAGETNAYDHPHDQAIAAYARMGWSEAGRPSNLLPVLEVAL